MFREAGYGTWPVSMIRVFACGSKCAHLRPLHTDGPTVLSVRVPSETVPSETCRASRARRVEFDVSVGTHVLGVFDPVDHQQPSRCGCKPQQSAALDERKASRVTIVIPIDSMYAIYAYIGVVLGPM